MSNETFGKHFQRLLNDFRSAHLAVCTTYEDPVVQYIADVKREIAEQLIRDYINLEEIHNYLNGHGEAPLSNVPEWTQPGVDLVIRECYPEEFHPRRKEISTALATFMANHGFEATIEMDLSCGTGLLRIIINTTTSTSSASI